MAAPQGLFGLGGMTPQEMQAQIDQAKALEYAKLTEDQRYAMAGATGGTMFGRGVQGLLGGGPTYDPTVRKAEAQDEILKSIDPADPKSLIVAAKVAQDKGDFETAFKLMQRYSEAMEQQDARAKAAAETAKAAAETAWKKQQTAALEAEGTPEAKAASRAEALHGKGLYTPESVEAYVKDPKNPLVRIDKTTKPGEDFLRLAGEFGFGAKGSFAEYTPEQIGKVNAALHKQKMEKATAAAANISLDASNKGKNRLYEDALGARGKGLEVTRVLAKDGQTIFETNQDARRLLDKGMITGAGADFLTTFNMALKQAGLDFGHADAASNTKAFAAVVGSNVGKIIKQFGSGTGLSDADREYAKAIAGGDVSMGEKAIRRLLDINDKVARISIERHNKDVKAAFPNDEEAQKVFLVPELPPPAPVMPEQVSKKPFPKPSSEAAFNARWKNMKPGETIVGLDGKVYTKGSK